MVMKDSYEPELDLSLAFAMSEFGIIRRRQENFFCVGGCRRYRRRPHSELASHS